MLLSTFRRSSGPWPRSLAFLGAIVLVLALAITAPGSAHAADGFATWYGAPFHGNVMYSGQIYDMYDPTTTAASFSFPMGTWVRVTNPANGQSVTVQVRDRGGFNYEFDLSYAAFKQIANPDLMGIPIRYEIVSGPSGHPVPTATPSPAPARAAPSARGERSAPTSANSYVVQSGDTLFAIAGRLGLSADTLAAWNGLSNPDSIREGQILRLSPPDGAPAAAGSGGTTQSYTVQAGDTLFGLADRFGVTVERIAALNGLTDPYPIVIGQELTLPSSPGSAASATSSTKTYIVRDGDTLDAIASRFGVSVDRLVSVNGISNPHLIQPDTKLTIPAP